MSAQLELCISRFGPAAIALQVEHVVEFVEAGDTPPAVPQIDLAELLELGGAASGPRTRALTRCGAHEHRLLWLGSLTRVMRVPVTALHPLPALVQQGCARSGLGAYVRAPEGLIFLLAPASLARCAASRGETS